MVSAREIHLLAETAREKDGDFIESLALTEKAAAAYIKEGDPLGLAEVHASRFSAFKHLFLETKNVYYLICAEYAIRAGVQIAEESKIESALSLPYYNLAMLLSEYKGDYNEAVDYYKKAIRIMKDNPPKSHKGYPGNYLVMEIHLAEAEWHLGDRSAIDRLEEKTREIEEKEARVYERDVWASGGYMKIARLLKDEDPNRAKEALNKAKQIIDSNSSLKLRLKQWEELASTFK